MLPPVETLIMWGAGGATIVGIATVAMKMMRKDSSEKGEVRAERNWLNRAVRLEWLVKSKRRDRSLAKLADQLAALDELRDKADRGRD